MTTPPTSRKKASRSIAVLCVAALMFTGAATLLAAPTAQAYELTVGLICFNREGDGQNGVECAVKLTDDNDGTPP